MKFDFVRSVNSPMDDTVKTIFSHDFGSANYGYAITKVKIEGQKVLFRIIENGLCPSTIRDLSSTKQRQVQRDSFISWLSGIRDQHQPDVLAGERYMTRGIKGPTIESVNIMIGAVENSPVFWPQMIKVIPAATWKNAVKRAGIDLKAEYKRVRVTPHQLDAVLIGLYIGFRGYGRKDFGDVDLPAIWDSILDQVELTSTNRLINRKVTGRVLPD